MAGGAKPEKDKPSRAALDWEAIERDYRTGSFTDRELGEKHGCSHTAIQKRAKRDQWQKDMAGAVKVATAAKLAEAEVSKVASAQVAKAVAKQVASAIPATTEVVAALAEVNFQVLTRHRSDIKSTRDLAMDMLHELRLGTHSQAELESLFKLAVAGANEDDAAALAQSFRDLMKLHNRVASVHKLSDTLSKLQTLERKAFSLDDAEAGKEKVREFSDTEVAARLAYFVELARRRKSDAPPEPESAA